MPTESQNKRSAALVFFAAMLLILLAVAAIRVEALQFPLERDEGEFALMGQLILDGIPPYKEVSGQKLPGIYVSYAAIMAVFGQNCGGIHLGLLLANGFTIFLLFLIAKELFDSISASIAASSYALLSAHYSVFGLAGHATHFVVLFALGGIVLLLRAFKRDALCLYFSSGILFGIAFLMKQPGFFFGAFGALLLILTCKGRCRTASLFKALTWYGLGFVIPYAAACLTLFEAGVFAKFWFWTHEYALLYATRLNLNTGRQLFKYSFGMICRHYTFLWICAGIGAALVFLKPEYRKHWIFFETFLIFSFLALSAGLYYRAHYFILLLPAVSLLIGVALCDFHKFLSQITGKSLRSALIAVGLFLALIAHPLVRQLLQITYTPFTSISRSIYGTNPFPESSRVAQYINARASASEMIAVLGSEPQIYFYARRKPATSYIYMYPLMESQKYAKAMQLDLIDQIETNKPKYIVFVDIPTSWLAAPNSKEPILDWSKQFLSANYTNVMTVEIGETSRYIREPDGDISHIDFGRSLTLYEYVK